MAISVGSFRLPVWYPKPLVPERTEPRLEILVMESPPPFGIQALPEWSMPMPAGPVRKPPA